MTQTQQASQTYQQLLQQEQQNATRLEELAQREQRAVQVIQTALQGHDTAMKQMQQILQTCRQLEQSISSVNAQSIAGIQEPASYMQQQNNPQGFRN